jgi:nitrite reductase (NO-forming)
MVSLTSPGTGVAVSPAVLTKSHALIASLVVLGACDRAEDLATRPASEVLRPAEPDVSSTPERVIEAQLTNAPMVPFIAPREKPARVVVNLEVKEVEREVAPGVRYTLWTFGGEVPGKMIRVRQGDVVELHLQNDPSSKMPHNIDLHAVTGPGGGAEGTFTAPGKQTQIVFRANHPGVYVYHCATAPVPMHVANGMYGLIVVEPPEGFGWADREYYVMQGELYTTGKYHERGLQQFDMDKGIDEKPTYVLFNGAEGSLVGDRAIRAKTGETVRIFVGNGGPNLTSSFHVIGEVFDKVWTEGGSQVQEHVQTTSIPAGGAAIVQFKVDVPGTYPIVDHALFRAFNKGAVGQLIVEGPPVPEVYASTHGDKPYEGAPATVAAPAPAALSGAELGKATFAKVCAACHQPDGKGVAGAFPPLAGSDYLATASADKLAGHIIHGLQGEITVNGSTYNGVMPPMAFLTDEEIATALTFVGSSWGNERGAVTTADVARARTR